MPDDKGDAMPTADLHGSTIKIETGKGEKTTFELVRLGTVKEFDTTKAALATLQSKFEGSCAHAEKLVNKLAVASTKLATADAAYQAEKETSADLNNKLTDAHASLSLAHLECDEKRAAVEVALAAEKADSAELRELIGKQGNELADAQERLAAERSEHERTGNALSTEKEVNAELQQANENVAAALASARAELTSQNEITDGLSDEAESFRAEIAEKESELESVKTAADVSKVERDRYEKERDDTKASFVALTERQARGEREFLGVSRERDVSRQALADLTAELLKDAGCMSDILDAMHKKITGE